MVYRDHALRIFHQDVGTFYVLGVLYFHVATSSRPSSNRAATKYQCSWASAAIDVFDDAIEYRNVRYYEKMVPIDRA